MQPTPAAIIMRHRLVEAVVHADVRPLRSPGRPYPLPATVIVAVVGKGKGADERKAAEAVMEEAATRERGVRKARRESRTRPARTGPTRACPTCAGKARSRADASETCASSHGTHAAEAASTEAARAAHAA